MSREFEGMKELEMNGMGRSLGWRRMGCLFICIPHTLPRRSLKSIPRIVDRGGDLSPNGTCVDDGPIGEIDHPITNFGMRAVAVDRLDTE
jgi:hypothetical protein